MNFNEIRNFDNQNLSKLNKKELIEIISIYEKQFQNLENRKFINLKNKNDELNKKILALNNINFYAKKEIEDLKNKLNKEKQLNKSL